MVDAAMRRTRTTFYVWDDGIVTRHGPQEEPGTKNGSGRV